MRYYSSSLQAMRIREEGLTALTRDGYVGVYANSSMLNPGRFAGKGQNDDTWKAVFSYYFDLWLSLRLIMAVDELWVACGGSGTVSETVREQLQQLLSESREPAATVADNLRSVLRKMDSSINEAAVTRELRITLGASAGHLVFGTAGAFGAVDQFRGCQFALLLDEFENFSELQQRCANTLIREKVPGVSFIVGARTFGVRTHETITGERNVEGSEFESIMLDSLYRTDHKAAYDQFCRNLVAKRLTQAGRSPRQKEEDVEAGLGENFVELKRTAVGGGETDFVTGNAVRDRKCLVKLRGQLQRYRPFWIDDDGIDEVVFRLHVAEDCVLEKVAVYLFYRAWHGGKDPRKAAKAIRAEARDYSEGKGATVFGTTVGHFRGDMLAQLLKEYRQKQRYLGFAECVALSGGLPRALLVVLKHIHRWAVFKGERPFVQGHVISEDSQRAGVREAADWFRTDLPSIGPDGAAARTAIERLGRFLNALRFSDKPTESSACTVGVDEEGLQGTVRTNIEHCIEFSFLLLIRLGHRDRNTRKRRLKLQLHPMLCPLWDLPTARRGVVELTSTEAFTIFGDEVPERFELVVNERLNRMNAPFGGASSAEKRRLFDD